MKTNSALIPSRKNALAAAAALLLAGYGISNATVISQTFSNGNEGGIVTFTDSLDDAALLNSQLKITFDNTTNGPTYSTAITGIVFNIEADIQTVSSFTFLDGNGNDISSYWSVEYDSTSSISNTAFDIVYAAGNINGGIYNAADPGSNLNNVFPDIATLILTISDPVPPYLLSSVGGDSVLRMQRAGTTGEDSLKLVTSTSSSTTSGGTTTSTTSGGTTTSTTSGGTTTSSNGSIPEPGMISLLGIGLLGQAFLLRQRRRRLQK